MPPPWYGRARWAGKRDGASTSQRTSPRPDERRVRRELDRAAAGAGELTDRPVADRGAQEIARPPEVALPRDRPEPGRERRRGLVRPVLGLGAARRRRSARPGSQSWTTTSRQPRSAARERGALAVGEDDADAALEPGREEAPRAERGEGVEARGDAGDLLRRRRLDLDRLPQRRGERARVERREEVRQRPVGQPGEAGRHLRDRRPQLERRARVRARASSRRPGPRRRASSARRRRRRAPGRRCAPARLVVAVERRAARPRARRRSRPRQGAEAAEPEPASREPDRGRRARARVSARARARRAEAPPRGRRARRAASGTSTQYPRPGRPAPAPRRPPPRGPEP